MVPGALLFRCRIWGPIGDTVAVVLSLYRWSRIRLPLTIFGGHPWRRLEKRSGRFRIVFRFDGQKYPHALNTDDFAEAEGCRIRLEENLRLLERGRLELPPEVDLPVFLLSDGMLNS